jgi:hypothetical protein
MQLKIRGKSKSITLAEARYATRFFVNKLYEVEKKSHIVPELEIELQFHNLPKDKGACWSEDDREEDPRYFGIEVDSRLSRRATLRTIAHEVVHVFQYSINKLKYVHDDKTIYNRRSFNPNEKEYWDWPSEIEAFGREEGLYYRYLDHCKDHGVKFLTPKDKL